MISSLPLPFLLLIFLASAAVVWIAGIYLSNTTDAISVRFHLGQALAGLILLAVAEDLPEVVITASGSLSHHLGLVIGNLLGGIAAQTVVLVVLDATSIPDHPFSYRAASLTLVLEGVSGVAVFGGVVVAAQLPASLDIVRLSPGAVLVAGLWVGGLWLVKKARSGLPWQEEGRAPGLPQPSAAQKASKERRRQRSTTHVLLIFGAAALCTLIAGYALEESSNGLAMHMGLSSVIFGGTILAAVTSLPELSVGRQAIKDGDYELAFSEVFGSNAFLPALILLAVLLSGQSVLPHAHPTDIFLVSLGIILTSLYIVGLVFRPRRQYFRLGVDSIAVLLTYLLGVAGLIAVAHG